MGKECEAMAFAFPYIGAGTLGARFLNLKSSVQRVEVLSLRVWGLGLKV